ncbi:YggS family pyridoxal phosphate-dependent enzyme [Corynebacterium simulans]|uniref:YggS family pyridoxal phosphate-dependent enzyme n=1 Tax=Corynebacterium simulans TaxID=146827 RepID=UPI001EF37186|nr:YggS family pyridoxal phosphate-dependent enzyme [Corynebacterium simulans]MCG7246363.1 YggS family pyridoxal phosphate-dependent enzyme [Corynebacterium simulans]
MTRKQQLQENLERARADIAEIAEKAGRPAPELLPVTKFHPAADVALLAELGITDVAENREQEARAKAAELPQMRFHMIGQIQTKKANHVARWAQSVHSLDTEKLARALDRGVGNALQAGEREGKLPVFIQLSHDGDSARGGVAYAEIDVLVGIVEDLDNLELRGFMVVPPLDADPVEVFARVRKLCDEVSGRLGRKLLMSAGMSADMAVAIAAGSDIVRVGTGIMGPRPLG